MQSYYLQTRGRVLGPFSKAEILAQIQRGSVSRVHEISCDKRTWCQAGDLPELFPPPLSQSTEMVAASPSLPAGPPALGGPIQNPAAGTIAESWWHYHALGQNQGPVGTGELAGLFASGQLTPNTMVWRQGWPQWMPANRVPELQPYLPRTAGSAGVPAWALVGGCMAAGFLILLIGAIGFTAAKPGAFVADASPAAREAIERVLQEDARTNPGAPSVAEVVDRMRRIDLAGCPQDFRAAYVAHIHAWERFAAVERQAIALQSHRQSGEAFAEWLVRSAMGDPYGKIHESLEADRQLQQHVQEAKQQIQSTFQRVEALAIGYGAKLP